MVFPPLPIYLDPHNWSQQQRNQEAGIGTQNLSIPPPLPPPPPTVVVGGGGGGYHQGGSIIRPGSMTERARLAKIPQPDAALKCPRCESTNTKFCYYNNYSLSQPRHFCKTCRRYWTRGGALRNVPVGGGCRRNKRSKRKNSSRSKSPAMNNKAKEAATTSASANSSSNHSGCANPHHDVISHHQLPFLPNLHHYGSDYINSGGIGFQIGTSSSNNGGNSILSSNGISEQWRLTNLQQVQQFPNFLSNLEPPPIGLFQSNKAMDSISTSVSGMPHQQLNTIKMEENIPGLSLSKNLSGNDLFWGGSGNNNAWNEISSFTSSMGHML